MSTQKEWAIFRALRSDSRECPSRIGVSRGAEEEATDGLVENGFAFGICDETGLSNLRTLACASSNVVVAVASDSAVIPDHLYQ